MKAILTKLFGAREKLSRRRGHDDKEMPFLDHLEELRQMLVKIILTLIVVTIGAFVFRAPLMEAIKRPVELAGLGASVDLPSDVSKLEWRKVRMLAQTARDLDSRSRDAFLQESLSEEDKDLRVYVQAYPIFNATLVLEKEKRERYVRAAVPDDPELRDTILKLVSKNADAKVDRQGNLIEMSALRPPEAFMLSLKISLMAGIIIAFPLLLYFVAQFVFPGLTLKEKKAVIPAVLVGFGLFLVGAAFAYWIVTPRVLEFFHGYADELGVSSEWRIGYYVSFVSQLVLIFGISFELPVVVMTLVKIDLLGYEFMHRNRAYAIVIIFTVAALITPTPDAPTLCLLAVPMVILYEICIWMAYFIDRKRRRIEAEEEAERAVHREKRAAAHEIALPPTGLPLGTVGHGTGDDGEAGSSSAEETSDESVQSAYADNDALQDDSDSDSGSDSGSKAAHDADDGVEYEEGFGPHGDEHDSPDAYSNYDFHNEPYEDPGDAPTDAGDSRDSEGAESVDGEPTQDQKEEGEDPPETADGSDDAPSPPSRND